MYSKETLQIVKRLQRARISLMKKQPFYAVLLLHMQFSLDPMCETIYTDGERIVFCPDFLNKISDIELEFVLMHEVLHVALNHCKRKMKDYDFDDYGTACDIVVNSNILFSCNNDISAITLKEYGESMHIAPDGKEGYYYTVEDVYRMIQEISISQNGKSKKRGKGNGSGGSGKGVEANGNGTRGKGNGTGGKGNGLGGSGDEEARDGKTDAESDEMPDEVRTDGGFDDHTFWEEEDSEENLLDAEGEWIQRMLEAAQITEVINRRGNKGYGGPPLCAQRIIKELIEPQTDWREILQGFLQEEINDYSFNPPDRRFQDSIFLLPDFNEKEESVRNIWFLIDTSGSISDKEISAAYSEIGAAIDQFDGRLEGWLSFTECYVTDPVPFSSIEEVLAIKPIGGGGNDFSAIFRYMNKNMMDDPPSFIVVITDGRDEYPDEEETRGIPVLWVINNEEITPPWGKIARIKIN